MALDSKQIQKLSEKIVEYSNSAARDYSIATRKWQGAIKAFGIAFGIAYNFYKNAIDQSAGLKRTVFDISFFSLCAVCGEGFKWVKAALMNKVDLYRQVCSTHFGGEFEKWTGGVLKDGVKELALNKISFQIPSHLNGRHPLEVANILEYTFFNNTQSVLDVINDLGRNFDSHEGAKLLEKMTHHMNWDEASNAVRWQFKVRFRQFVMGSCYYYTHAPDLPPTDEMSKRIERCMWAETFKGKSPVPPKWLQYPMGAVPPAIPAVAPFETLRYVLYKPGAPVEKRLIELGVMAPTARRPRDPKRNQSLDNFGLYTDDNELKSLLKWAYAHVPEYIGGPLDPTKAIPSKIMGNYRTWQLKALA